MLLENMKALREDNEMERKNIAKLLGMAQNTYAQCETGEMMWGADQLIKLSDFYGVSVDYLLEKIYR